MLKLDNFKFQEIETIVVPINWWRLISIMVGATVVFAVAAFAIVAGMVAIT